MNTLWKSSEVVNTNSRWCPSLLPSTWSMQALFCRNYMSNLELQTLALPTVVFVYPPWTVTGAEPNHCHHRRARFWLWKADENTNNSLWFFTFAGSVAGVFSLVLVISRNADFKISADLNNHSRLQECFWFEKIIIKNKSMTSLCSECTLRCILGRYEWWISSLLQNGEAKGKICNSLGYLICQSEEICWPIKNKD